MAQQTKPLFELLKKDHRQVEQLMKQILNSDEEQRVETFSRLRSALGEHMQIEEKHFYPPLKSYKEMKELVDHALDEHKEIKEFLLELDEMDSSSNEWRETFQKMQEGLADHIKDEETKIFPKSAQVLSDQQIKDIGQKCAHDKEKGHPSRPAPVSGAKKQSRRQVHP